VSFEKMSEENPISVPDKLMISLQGFEEEKGKKLGNLVLAYVKEISRNINLSSLDGITIAFDYKKALLELDRGYETSHKLTPSDGEVLGIAMTPSVIRNGIIKSHILLHAGLIQELETENSELFKLAFHTLAHECAHVEVTNFFDKSFPNVLLKKSEKNGHELLKDTITQMCWDEFAVTSIVAKYGADPTESYEDIFINFLGTARDNANQLIKAYRLHGDNTQILAEVYNTYGELMKFGAYHLGNMYGHGLKVEDLPNTLKALDGHWFASFFKRMDMLLKEIGEDYGKWEDMSKFNAFGRLVDEVVEDGGLFVELQDNGSLYVKIPYSKQTMPK
jgi:hypothetical protein